MYFQVQDKIAQVQDGKSEIQFGSLDCCSIPFDRSKVACQQKISKHKKPISCPFETQIVICFFQILKERNVHLVPVIVDLAFL